jgi:transposase
VVDQLNLGPFLRAYRADGHGHPAYDPKALLGVLLYAYAIGVRSSRQIQRRCREDLAFRVLAGNQLPDHVTIARFRVRHQQALAGFLVESLRLCAAVGLVRLGVVALDGTKLAANAASRPRRGWRRRRPSGGGGMSSGSRTWPQRPGPAGESPAAHQAPPPR